MKDQFYELKQKERELERLQELKDSLDNIWQDEALTPSEDDYILAVLRRIRLEIKKATEEIQAMYKPFFKIAV